ncbi:MAG: hypothetical protein JWP49_297 [Phenylobacterium sp.]|jgi:hypothetical protein|nr:hypothetical protein [Phenylobacterium sp.]
MRTPILALALALCSGAALAQTAAPAPVADAAVSTAPTVADQIDAFIKAAPVPDVTTDRAPGVTSLNEPQRDRAIHGVVELGIGTNGYRHAYGRADMPIGDTGTLSIAVDQTRFNGRRGGGRYYGNRSYGGDSLSLGASWRSGDLTDGCRPRATGDLGEPLYAGPPPGSTTPGACRTIERTGP